jgi:hypothetical protein
LRKSVAALVVLGALAFGPAAAQASSGCPNEPPSSQVFLDYGDSDLYFLAPGGDFESSSDWTLLHGASVTAGGSNSSLTLPPGALAISPPICVGQNYPHGRMFGAAVGGRERARLDVDVVYDGSWGFGYNTLKLRGDDLSPTERFLLDESAFGLDPITGASSVRLVLVSGGPSTAVVDDINLDPRARN